MRALPEPILVPVNGSPWCDDALEWTIVFARRLGHPLLLAFVVEPWQCHGAYEISHTRSYLDDLAHRVRIAGVACEVEVGSGEPGPVLLDLVKVRGARYIALGTRVLSTLEHPSLGAVGDWLVEREWQPPV